MPSSIVDQFIEKSAAVNNENYLMSKNELTKIIKPDSYANIPAINLYKDIQIEKNGINKAFIQADYGIAETGTIVLNSTSEKLRMASSLSEHLIIILPESSIVEKLYTIEKYLREKTKQTNSYIAFITGASRTADIERVLTIGVHGPVKMSVFIINDL
jgi:L-lactate dehydrogenase complex protein LldG